MYSLGGGRYVIFIVMMMMMSAFFHQCQSQDPNNVPLLMNTIMDKLLELTATLQEVQRTIGNLVEQTSALSEQSLASHQCCQDSREQMEDFRSIFARDECEENSHNCSHLATCNDHMINYDCTCLEGYSGDGLTCTDENCFVAGTLPSLDQRSLAFRKQTFRSTLENAAQFKTTYAVAPLSVTRKDMVVDGIEVVKWNCFHSEPSIQRSWWLVDLGVNRLVKEVHILPYGDGSHYVHFKNVEVRLGNTLMTSGDFSSYTLINSYTGPPTTGVNYIPFIASKTLCGRYVSVQRVLKALLPYLVINEVKVLAYLEDKFYTDECKENSHNCSHFATCNDHMINYDCTSLQAYSGGGLTCTNGNCFVAGTLPSLDQRSLAFRKQTFTSTLENVAQFKTTYAVPPFSVTKKDMVVDGIEVVKWNCFHSEPSIQRAWWLVDLGVNRLVKEVHILPYGDGSHYVHFKNVEVRLGNTLMTTGDFSSYTLINSYTGPPTTGVNYIPFVASKTLCGRYVSVQRVLQAGAPYLVINEVKVLAYLESK